LTDIFTTTKKLKIWTIISGLILVGAGHGIMVLSVLEILFFPYVTKQNFTFKFDIAGHHFPVVGMTTFLGQIFLMISILTNKQTFKNLFQIVGLCFLLLSIIYFTYDATKDSCIHIALITVIPFFICVIMTFADKLIKSLYDKILDI